MRLGSTAPRAALQLRLSDHHSTPYAFDPKEKVGY
ncbi:hypothetical protein STVIR_7063 [Streptomyces viridochromogenes Tue57]|uniref:Uncharacterized protein n=1 Tax=Streptomyces viridochromogenes Tue57 TaxID=1160705 RepID=L8P363_STRVR|nr:hypothetical protein STVIR_7063 [Streptomyces viridochromogenes Tue57]